MQIKLTRSFYKGIIIIASFSIDALFWIQYLIRLQTVFNSCVSYFEVYKILAEARNVNENERCSRTTYNSMLIEGTCCREVLNCLSVCLQFAVLLFTTDA